MRLTLFEIPYDSGHFGARMGGGPLHLVERGLPGDLEHEGHEVRIVPVRLPDGFVTEVGAALEIQCQVANGVRSARSEGRFPLLFSGNCNASVGALAGISPEPAGVVWLDAHGDFNTPDTSLSGFFDGMALTVLTGLSWRGITGRIPGFEPVAPRDVVLVGARDLDPDEERLIESSGTAWVRAGEIRALGPILDALSRRVPRVHLHIDLDVLDPSEGRANAFAVPGGLTVEEVVGIVEETARRFEVTSATLSAYDPGQDPEDRIVRAAEVIVRAIAMAAG
jgi:arginase